MIDKIPDLVAKHFSASSMPFGAGAMSMMSPVFVRSSASSSGCFFDCPDYRSHELTSYFLGLLQGTFLEFPMSNLALFASLLKLNT